LGWLYDVSPPALIAVGVALELLAIPFLLVVTHRMRATHARRAIESLS
jgi:hypothetical protein